MESPAHNPVPKIPDYDTLRMIGRGGYGEVWLVRSITGLYRAAKVVWRDRFAKEDWFEREFRAVEAYGGISLEDPRLLKVLHVGRNPDAGYFYYVMELADDLAGTALGTGPSFQPASYRARTLRADLDDSERLTTTQTLQLGIDLSRAVQSLHERGLVHRDIKPSNIVYVGGIPKLGDIGLVTGIREGATCIGTTGYIPPEGQGQPAADIYAVGKVLYEAVNGLPVAEYPRLANPPTKETELPRWRELNEIILRAAAGSVKDRYPSAQDLLKDLLLVEAGTSVRGWLQLRRQAKWLKLAALVMFGLFLGALSIWQAQRTLTDEQRSLNQNLQILTKKQQSELNHTRYTLAQLEISSGRHARAQAVLREIWPGPPKEAPVEWRMLFSAAHGDPDQVYFMSGTSISQVQISSNGAVVAARSIDNRLEIWKNDTSPLQESNVLSIGRFLGQGPDLLWLKNNKHQNELFWGTRSLNHSDQTRLAMSASQEIVTGGSETNLTYTILSGVNFEKKIAVNLPPHAEQPTRSDWAVATDGGSRILVHFFGIVGAHMTNSLELWDAKLVVRVKSWGLPHLGESFAISPDERFVAIAASTTGPTVIVDMATDLQRSLTNETINSLAESVVFDPSKPRLATGGTDGVVRIWDVRTGKLTHTLIGHSPGVRSMAWSEDGRYLVSGDDNGSVRRWNLNLPISVPSPISGFWKGQFGNFALGENGYSWAASRTSGDVGVWLDWATVEPTFSIPSAFEPIKFTGGDRILWVSETNGIVRAWNLLTRQQLNEFGPIVPTPPPAAPGSPEDPREKRFAKAVVDPVRNRGFGMVTSGRIVRWDMANNREDGSSQSLTAPGYLLELNNSGSCVAAMGCDGSVACWNTSDFSLRWTDHGTPGEDSASGLAFSSDGEWVAAGTQKGLIRILNATTGKRSVVINRQTSAVMALTWTPDGRSIISSHSDGLLAWTELASNEERLIYSLDNANNNRHAAPIWRLQMTLDGQKLVGLDNASKILHWQSTY